MRNFGFSILEFRLALCSLALPVLLGGVSQNGPNAEIAKLINGTWKMGTPIRGLHVLMVIRQDGNMYPSFWGGRNDALGGPFALSAKEDDLTDELVISSTGGFITRCHHAPPKAGMEESIPGGVWMRTPGWKIEVEYREFRDWKRVASARGDAILLESHFEGTFRVNKKESPISGKAFFNIPRKVGTFNFRAEFVMNGADVDLQGTMAGPLNIKVLTRAPSSTDLPPAANELIEIDVKQGRKLNTGRGQR